jgi:hypothetical protein
VCRNVNIEARSLEQGCRGRAGSILCVCVSSRAGYCMRVRAGVGLRAEACVLSRV